jgi:hypothetical protein
MLNKFILACSNVLLLGMALNVVANVEPAESIKPAYIMPLAEK